MALGALQRRVAKLEIAQMPQPSPFTIWFGSTDAFVDIIVIPGIQAGALHAQDMADIVAAIRSWEESELWDRLLV